MLICVGMIRIFISGCNETYVSNQVSDVDCAKYRYKLLLGLREVLVYLYLM
jgi:hypothetical protein